MSHDFMSFQQPEAETMYYPLCKKDRLEVLKIVGTYALFGALWIYFSDATLGWLVRDPDTITLLATYKGLLFIVVTAFLLYGLVSRYIFREAESRLQIEKSEERKRLFFEQKLFGMGISSPEKEWIQFNDTLCEMLGYSREEFEQLRCEEMTHPDDMAKSNVMFGRLIAGELNEYSFEKRYIRKDG
ncbi:MAG: PAS domain S-box protein, partial [Deltaproteobacteria bacterium]|nr:PAS domain S-box protein [Deltaproteobacteria bacterium]